MQRTKEPCGFISIAFAIIRNKAITIGERIKYGKIIQV